VARFGPLYGWVTHLYYFDEFYRATVVRLGALGARVFARFDALVIDGAVNGVGALGEAMSKGWGLFDKHVVDDLLVNSWWHASQAVSRVVRRIQTGNLQDYLVYAVGGMALVSLLFLFLAH
jgi:NADH:ubiquinone oxidoreductase subunit 5 (subunit L)/multisubunit Na+/H+ antiporter MnhA subunit